MGLDALLDGFKSSEVCIAYSNTVGCGFEGGEGDFWLIGTRLDAEEVVVLDGELRATPPALKGGLSQDDAWRQSIL